LRVTMLFVVDESQSSVRERDIEREWDFRYVRKKPTATNVPKFGRSRLLLNIGQDVLWFQKPLSFIIIDMCVCVCLALSAYNLLCTSFFVIRIWAWFGLIGGEKWRSLDLILIYYFCTLVKFFLCNYICVCLSLYLHSVCCVQVPW